MARTWASWVPSQFMSKLWGPWPRLLVQLAVRAEAGRFPSPVASYCSVLRHRPSGVDASLLSLSPRVGRADAASLVCVLGVRGARGRRGSKERQHGLSASGRTGHAGHNSPRLATLLPPSLPACLPWFTQMDFNTGGVGASRLPRGGPSLWTNRPCSDLTAPRNVAVPRRNMQEVRGLALCWSPSVAGSDLCYSPKCPPG